ncbi:MAG: PilZ domain-containing protein [Spirochaetales bacterium]|uniref:PilZ domain-containing protein n=1 Tax=Candidatus Thalassospirochaeta sargassi TaxID=3119039 RepID=A0AAJ1MN08_9SPIO|nr:PilZ domain-containing protein [Spirochaetales bacterium]
MKLLLVTENEETQSKISSHFERLGYDIITYDNPLKAMDNLAEIAPNAVLFNAEDFPRHWKPFLQVLRQLFSRDDSVFVILKGSSFNDEEAVKAGSLSVSGVISEDFESSEEIVQLENIFSRYLVHNDSRGPRRFTTGLYQNVEFLFNHPENFTLITGTVSDVSFDGIRITPDHPHHTTDIKEGTNIHSCSIRFGDYVCSVGVRVVRNNKSISFRFVDFDESDRAYFIDFLDTLTYKNHAAVKA